MHKISEESKPRMNAFLVLYFLHEQKELSGYAIAKTIKERMEGYISSTAGNVYPVLEDLVRKGLIRGNQALDPHVNRHRFKEEWWA